MAILLSQWAVLVIPVTAPVQAEGPPQSVLSGEVDLARLVDFGAQRLGLKVDYEARTLQGLTVTLRLESAVTDDQIWNLASQLLAARGFTSVRAPGDGTLSIVKISEAAGMARIEPGGPVETPAGFVNVVLEVRHRQVKDLLAAITPLLLKPGGAATALGDQGRILISDLRPRVEQILGLMELLDAPGAQTIVRVIPSQFLAAPQLAAAVAAAATARNAIAPRPLAGKMVPGPDGDAVVLVAPEDELGQWTALIEQFDRRQAVESRSYVPRHFSVTEVGRLIEQTAREPGPQGAGERWRIVSDDLTGALIVTATPREHERIQALVERLDSVPVEARRPVRAFRIRNRDVKQIVEVLTRLIEAGVLETGEVEGAAPVAEPAVRQRTERDVLPPGARPLLEEPQQGQPTPALRRGAAGRGAQTPGQAGQPSLVLTADEGTNTLIAVGEARRLDQLADLIRTLDQRQPQVMLEALVVALTEGDTLDLGVELESMTISGSTLISLASLFGLRTPGVDTAEPLEGTGGTALVLSPGDFRVLVRALQTINHGRSLNIPKVLVSNNQQASLDSVLQQPFLSTNASNTVATTSFGGTQDAGTTVTVTPQIAEADHLVLTYSLSLSAFVGESSDPALPPPRQQTTLQSVVTIPDGYTVAIGGLEVETAAEAVSQVPFIGDIPLVGELFKSKSKSLTRSRFYLFIQANILRQRGFEDLKYLSDQDVLATGVDDGWPHVEPRVIK